MQAGVNAVAMCEMLEGMTGEDILLRFLHSTGLHIGILNQASSSLCHCRHHGMICQH